MSSFIRKKEEMLLTDNKQEESAIHYMNHFHCSDIDDLYRELITRKDPSSRNRFLLQELKSHRNYFNYLKSKLVKRQISNTDTIFDNVASISLCGTLLGGFSGLVFPNILSSTIFTSSGITLTSCFFYAFLEEKNTNQLKKKMYQIERNITFLENQIEFERGEDSITKVQSGLKKEEEFLCTSEPDYELPYFLQKKRTKPFEFPQNEEI